MRGEILSISVVSRPSGDPYLTISRISIILSKLATTTTTTTPWIPPFFQPFAHRKKTRREAQDPHLDVHLTLHTLGLCCPHPHAKSTHSSHSTGTFITRVI